MRPFKQLNRRRAIGCVVVCLLLGGCSREDLSQYLAAGKCDDQGLCADGYECEASTWECLKAGQGRDAGAAGQAPDAPSPPTTDAASVESDVGGANTDAVPPDGGAPSQPDACPPGGCLCNGLTVCTPGMTCCLGYGCADLDTQSDHCGACGKSCPKLHKCQGGACRCQNDKACEAGASGVCTSQGRCQCDGVVCAPGLRCVAAGVCG